MLSLTQRLLLCTKEYLLIVFFPIPGLKLRRQHWFFLGCLLLVIIFTLALTVPISSPGSSSTSLLGGEGGSGSNYNPVLANDPDMQRKAVAQLLTDVPLIDG